MVFETKKNHTRNHQMHDKQRSNAKPNRCTNQSPALSATGETQVDQEQLTKKFMVETDVKNVLYTLV